MSATTSPAVGRTVHYVVPDPTTQCLAVVIAEVYPASRVTCVRNPEGTFFHDVLRDEDTKAAGTWHWPENV